MLINRLTGVVGGVLVLVFQLCYFLCDIMSSKRDVLSYNMKWIFLVSFDLKIK